MNWSMIEARWHHYQASAAGEWTNISRGRIADTRGRREDLASRVRDAYGLSEADAQQRISDWQLRQVEELTPRGGPVCEILQLSSTGRWKWRYTTPAGAVSAESAETYRYHFECAAAARRNGYRPNSAWSMA
jgi:hypothetical protein